MTSPRKRERTEPGHRVTSADRKDLAAPPRDDGDREIEAELVRGISYALARSPRSVIFEFGTRVPITRKEFDYLTATALDRVTARSLRPTWSASTRCAPSFARSTAASDSAGLTS